MTPQSPSHHAFASRTIVRRAATIVIATVAICGAPLVAQARDDAPQPTTFAPATGTPGDETPLPLAARGGKPIFQPIVEDEPAEPATVPDTAPPSEPAIDPAILVLTDTYEWDEHSPRVEALQVLLGVAADGWYGHETARAHRTTLEFAGLPTDDLPVPVLPPGPSADEWAAMRQCEAGGDYTITNPSGKYRGAYQFDRSTWDSVAGRNAPALVGVDPAAAAPADQDAMALALYHERGSAPWPHCGRHLS